MRASERLAPLLAQLDTSWEMLRERLAGITDDEFLWEPAPGAFSVRRHGDRWVADRGERGPNVGSVRTIAWLAGHVGEGCLLRADYTVGSATVGRSQMPWGLDPELPLIDIVWWQNREVIHHGGEMAWLRDLYAHVNR